MASSLSCGRRRQRKTSQEERICSVCSQSFKKAEHLARHFRSYTKERPFMCQVCGRLYARQDTLLRHARSQHLGTQPHEHPAHGNSGPTSPPISDPVSHLATLEKPATDQVCASIDSIIPAPEQVLPELQFSSLDHDSNTATTPSLVHSPQHVDVRAPTTRNLPENDNNSVPAFLTYRQGQLNSARLLMTWRGPAELELQLLLGPRDLSSWVLRR